MKSIGTDLTKGSVTRTLLRFTVPFLLANVLHTVYSIVDMFIVGRFADATQLSAVSIASGITMPINNLLMGFAAGGTVLVGQMVGSRRDKDLDETISTMFSVFPLFAVGLLVLFMLLRSQMLSLVNTPPEAWDGAYAYMTICLFGLLFNSIYCAIAGILRGMGDSQAPTIFVAISCCCNIVGDVICVGALRMGAAGAALATTVSQGISVLAGYVYLRRHNFAFDFKIASFHIHGDKFRSLLRMGIPTALQETLTSISFFVLEAIINKMGYLTSAAVGVANRIFTVSIVPGIAFSSAVAAMVAQNHGAGEYSRSRKCLRTGLSLSFFIAAAIFAVMAIWPEQLIGVFTDDAAVADLGAEYMYFYKFDCLICSLAFCINGYINGTGHTRYTMLVNLIASFAVRLPLVWAISRMPNAGLRHIGLGVPSASVIQVIVGLCFLLFAKSEREHRSKERLA